MSQLFYILHEPNNKISGSVPRRSDVDAAPMKILHTHTHTETRSDA